MDGVNVYNSRVMMGEKLANKIQRVYGDAAVKEIDVVIPIPETSRTSALQCAHILNKPYREGFVKNRYIARTFIMPGQEMRKKTVRLKLNTIRSEFEGKCVLLVDDSIVRGTTSIELIQMARDAGAKTVYFASAAPPVRYSNVYGIDIPTRQELVAHNRNEKEIGAILHADHVIYNELSDVIDSVAMYNPKIKQMDASCFDGKYVTGDIDEEYINNLESRRGCGRKGATNNASATSTVTTNSPVVFESANALKTGLSDKLKLKGLTSLPSPFPSPRVVSPFGTPRSQGEDAAKAIRAATESKNNCSTCDDKLNKSGSCEILHNS
jgi:amidophosphoribosyltransferase